MGASTQILVFGDQTISFSEGLRRLLRTKDNAALVSLFSQVYYASRLEIGQLPPSQRSLFPRFSDLFELLPNSIEYPNAADSYVIGTCTGGFAAAAISSSKTIAELIPAGIEAVLIALRFGICALEAKNRLSISESERASWSAIVGDITEEKASELIVDYCQSQNIPPSSWAYVSATGHISVTISGPPATLKGFFCKTVQVKPIDTAVDAPFHAPHLFTSEDVASILSRSVGSSAFKSCLPRLPIFSNRTGLLIETSDYASLLQVLLTEALMEPLRWDRLLDQVPSTISTSGAQDCNIVPFAANGLQSLSSALRRAGIPDVQLQPGSNKNASNRDDHRRDARKESKIAIIGFSGRFPESDNTDEFWELLYEGLDVHKEVPKERWDAVKYFDSTGKTKNTSGVTKGCWIKNPGLFDARFFNMSPREATQADPAQRLAIMTAYEALEMAGIVPDATPSTQRDRVGIFYGMTSDDWREVNSGQNIDTYFIPGGNRAFTPGRINYHFKFGGPSYSVDTACSSSLAAIHLACNSLWRGDCDTALAGGTNILTNPDNFAGLDRAHFLSRTGNCNTFDDAADGYCRADCVGSLVMKRLEDAQADGDPIWATINGAYTNHSAEAVSITRPHVGAQVAIFDKILNAAGIDQSEISYTEMHGTGTQQGDAVEMRSVLSVFAPSSDARSQSLHLGSAKANIGHAESASGVASVIKVLLMMQKNLIPPRGFPTDLSKRNIHIAMQPTPWIRPSTGSGTRKAFLNNFSAAGGNTALLLEDSPVKHSSVEQDPRTSHMVAVSAKSLVSLRNNIAALTKHVEENPDVSIGSLSYTTTARRLHHPHRLMVHGSDVSAILKALKSAMDREKYSLAPASGVSTIFAFTGQGSHYLAMGKQLLDLPRFRSDIRQFDGMAREQGFPSILPLTEGTCDEAEVAGLPAPTIQLGIVCLEMAIGKLLKSLGVMPEAVIGHSLGEYAALNFAGVLSDSDTVYLVGRRAQLLQEYCTVGTHSMLAVKSSAQDLISYLTQGLLEVACINGPEDTVISGPEAEIDSLFQDLSRRDVKSTKLETQFAFHSAQVEPMLIPFEMVASSIKFHEPSVPVISPLLGQIISTAESFGPVPTYLSRHCREMVNLKDALRFARSEGLVSEKTLWIEVGPHPVCSGMIKATLECQSITFSTLRRGEDPWKTFVPTLSQLYERGVDISWSEYHHNFQQHLSVLHLPSYKWNTQNHWIDYVYDWCLTKGNAPAISATSATVTPIAGLAPILSSTVQRIIQEEHMGDSAFVIAESDLAHPDFVTLLQSHKVNGVALCTSSAYADIALTLGDYLLRHSFLVDKKGLGMEIADVVAEKPLLWKDQPSQLIRISASADWSLKVVEVTIFSVTNEGRKTVDHAKCVVKFGRPEEWLSEWKRHAYLIKDRIEQMRKNVHDDSESAILIKRGMFYKLFSSLVEYSDLFKGHQEVIFQSTELEATGNVKFQATEKDGKYFLSPYWIDSIGQLSGFAMNANDTVDSRSQVFMNHGWDSMKCAKPFSSTKTYQTYVKMEPVSKNMYAGDVHVLDEGEIISVYQGIRFQGIPRDLLNLLLPPPKKKAVKTLADKKTVVEAPVLSVKSQAPTIQSKSQVPNVSIAKTKGVVERAIALLAGEVGVSTSELGDDEELANFGIDSLLSLAIAGKFREELDLDFDSSLFADCVTIKDLRAALGADIPPEASQHHTIEEPIISISSSTSLKQGSSVIDDSISSNSSVGSVDSNNDIIAFELLRKTLAEEIGLSVSDLTDDEELSDLGLDSLMSLTVLGKLREALDIELSSDFLLTRTTLGGIREYFIPTSIGEKTSLSDASNAFEDSVLQVHITQTPAVIPPATSVLLQGQPKTASRILFLFPDESGLGTSYLPLPKIGPNVAVWGLNCPFVKKAQDMKCTFRELTASYVNEVRARQPHGPYNLGGWSAGGICAYDAAQQLQGAGERVDRLLLLDSPFPIGLQKLPPRLYEFFSTLNLFGEGGKPPPGWLLPHFLAFIDVLDTYKGVVPFAARTAPKTYIAWACDGVCQPGQPRLELKGDDPREMKWLINDRTELGPNGWDVLCGGAQNVRIELLRGANHFTMMRGGHAKELGAFIRRALL
ncbi:MAG: hypothetical protein M1818_003863 [Claussenomyces sp. TS43310]|nr:MAG: hypothetical protein M1818_003863 [Claussenomyces sp. TS43310]